MKDRVSIFNCVSNALEMLKFSSEAIIKNAGTENFDYIIVHWRASDEVLSYIEDLKSLYPDVVSSVKYETNPSVGFVPNLRGMMNTGFEYSYTLNDYAGLVNTDMYFGKDWLINLIKFSTPDTIVNSIHITPNIQAPHVITADLGIPEEGLFDHKAFEDIYARCYEDKLESEDERGGWLNTNTMPYLIHRKFWDLAGPWELTGIKGSTPDRRFFARCHDCGAKFTMSHSSIVYHYEAVERTTKKPEWADEMYYDK